MTTPKLELAGLKEPAAWEYVIRFVFGGLVTVGTGLIGDHYGPVFGGVFLAFPAILPATLTLVKRHDGRARAVDDARGACVGALALIPFAATIGLTARAWPAPLSLAAAAFAWLAVSTALWTLVFGRR